MRQLSRRGWELVRPHGSAPKGISKAIASPSPMSTRAQSSFLDARRPYHGALQSQATFEPAACRNFTSTSFAASKTVVNPRMDDEGNEMKIEILPRASHVSLSMQIHSSGTRLICIASCLYHGKGQQSIIVPPCVSRVGRMSWVPVPHVAHEQGEY